MEIWGGNEAIDTAVSVPGIDAWIYSQTYRGQPSGGDIHYISLCGGGKIARFFVADVAGHGVEVSELARKLRDLMRKHINKVDQTRFVRALNDEFMRLNEAGMFATAALSTYFAPTDHLVVCLAGHPPPLWYRVADRQWRYLAADDAGAEDAVTNLPIGIIDAIDYTQFAVPLDRGDLVLVYTDGLTETADAAGEMLGDAGLLELVRSIDVSPLDAVCPTIVRRVAKHRGGGALQDDLTLFLLHHNAANPPRQSLREMVRVIGKMIGLSKV